MKACANAGAPARRPSGDAVPGGAALSLAASASVTGRRPAAEFRWRYEDGLVLHALAEVGRRRGGTGLLPLVRDVLEGLVGPDGRIAGYRLEDWNLDQVRPGVLLLDLARGSSDPRWAAAIAVLRGQLRAQPRSPSGAFWHKGIYPNQLWLDGLYMAAPFYLRASLESGAGRAGVEDILAWFRLAEEHCLDTATGLLRHAWDESRKEAWSDPLSGRSPHAWGRAMGWFAMALVDCIGLLPSGHEGRTGLCAMLSRVAEAVRRHADAATGLWWQVMDWAAEGESAAGEANYLEASASCMFVYALARGVALGCLAPPFLAAAEKAWSSVVERFVSVGKDGLLSLGGICQVAGLGGKPYRDGSCRYYLSEPVVSDDFKGVGPFILAALEIEDAALGRGQGRAS